MEDLAKSWSCLTFSDVEGSHLSITEEDAVTDFVLAAKFLTKRALNIEAIAKTFTPLWRMKNGFKVTKESDHVVLFTFDSQADLDWVLHTKPWSFDKHLILLRLGKSCDTLAQLIQRARSRLRDFSLHNTSMVLPMVRPPTQWQPPEHLQYKINFNGALFKAENYAGIGAIIRNSEGQVMMSLSQRIPLPTTAIEVEALAARRAMELALEIGLNKGVLEGDSQVLINALNTNSLSFTIWSYCKRYMVFSLSFLHPTASYIILMCGRTVIL